MEEEGIAVLRKLFDALIERMESIESRQLATDVLVMATLQSHPDRTQVLRAADSYLRGPAWENPKNTAIVKEARVRLLAIAATLGESDPSQPPRADC